MTNVLPPKPDYNQVARDITEADPAKRKDQAKGSLAGLAILIDTIMPIIVSDDSGKVLDHFMDEPGVRETLATMMIYMSYYMDDATARQSIRELDAAFSGLRIGVGGEV
jgi:hypothetical protein